MIISQSREEEVDQSLLKIIFLGFLSAVFFGAAVYCFNIFLVTAQYLYFWISFFSGGFFVALAVLNSIFIKSNGRLQLITLTETLVAIGIFYQRLYPNISWVLIGAAAVFFVLIFIASGRGMKVLTNSVKIHFLEVAKVVAPKIMTAFLIFLSVVVYLNYFEWNKFNEKIGKELVNQTLNASNPVLKVMVTGASFDQKVGDFLKAFVDAELRKVKTDVVSRNAGDAKIDFRQLPPTTRAGIVDQAAKEAQKALENMVGPVNPDETLKDLIYRLAKNYLVNLSPQLKAMFGVIVGISVFFFFKGIAALLYWLVYFLAFLIYKFLLAVNFAHVGLETRSREFVILS
jgi:hypothetical protein